MLNECRTALRITTEAYDGELCSLMVAGARDLTIAGVRLPGMVSFSQVTTSAGGTQWQDISTLRDPLAMRAVLTYVRMHFGSPDDYDRLKGSYDNQKAQLMTAEDYTDFDGDGDC